MSKKDFTGGLSSLLGDKLEDSPKKGRPRVVVKEIQKSSQEGTKEGETRATFIVNENDLDKLKAIAFWERRMIKRIIGEAIREYIDKYEKEKGELDFITIKKD